MTRVNVALNNFTGGEIGPYLDARADLAFYANSCRILENAIVRPQGGLFRRGGLRFIASVKNHDKKTGIIPFIFSTVQAYIIEFGDGYCRFYKDGGRIELFPGAPVEIATPYAASDLGGIKYAQSADVIYLVHPKYRTRKISRTSHTSWTIETVNFIDGPYLGVNTDTTKKLAPSAASGNITITATGHTPFVATDVGRLIRIKHSSTWGYAEITGFTSNTVVTATVKSNFGGTSAVADWQLGLWSETTGYAGAITFHQERLFFGGGTKVAPGRIDGSKSADFENFTPGPNDADALSYNIASDTVNIILWLISAKVLLVGTNGGEFRLSADGKLTPDNVQVARETSYGVADVQPAFVQSTAMFLQRGARKLRDFSYSFENDGYQSTDLNLRAHHLTGKGLVALSYTQEPDGVLWSARADGLLLGLTYLKSEQVMAWHRHPLGGKGIVESVASIPGPNGDELWAVVRRTVIKQTRRYIERLEQPLGLDGDLVQAFYIDSGLTYDGAVAAALTPGPGADVTETTDVIFTASAGVFSAGDVGREIRYHVAENPYAYPVQEAVEARAIITAYQSATVVKVKILAGFSGTLTAGTWRKSVTQISGLDHLEGETVQILTDGAVHPERIVENGTIKLDYPATVIHAGLQYITIVKPMKIEAGAQAGSAQGQTKRIDKLIMRLFRTLGAKIGRSMDKLDELPFRNFGGLMDAPPELFTGDKGTAFRGTHDQDADIIAVQDQPLPFAVSALLPRQDVGEG